MKRAPGPAEIEAELSRSRDLVVVKEKRLELDRALEELMGERAKIETEKNT